MGNSPITKYPAFVHQKASVPKYAPAGTKYNHIPHPTTVQSTAHRSYSQLLPFFIFSIINAHDEVTGDTQPFGRILVNIW